MSNEMKILYSVGYGIIEGTHTEKRDKFIKRLEYIQRGIGKPVTVVDIRNTGSGSRNGPLFAQPKTEGDISGMRLLFELFDEKVIGYKQEPDLCNRYGSALWQLKRYHGSMFTRLCFPNSPDLVRAAFERVQEIAEKGDRAVLLLCGCLKAFKPNGATWNCHRVPLGNLLGIQLGEGWKTVHL